MRHEMLSQRAPFCIGAMAKKGTLSQHFVTHAVPPLHVVRKVFQVNPLHTVWHNPMAAPCCCCWLMPGARGAGPRSCCS